MILEIGWILFTLLLVSIGAIIAKKYGVEYIIVLVAGTALMANVFAAKIITFFGMFVTAGTIIYSVSYFLTDMLSEFYGKKQAQKAVWCGFFVNIVYLTTVFIVLQWQPAPFWENQEAFTSTLSTSLRITFASLIFYLIPQLIDTYLFDKIKTKTKGKYLWVRNNGSTMISQFIDTAGFLLIAFIGILPLNQIVTMIFSMYIIKVLIAMLDTPYLYAIKWVYKKI